jgi:hypothetical protein
MKYAAQGLSVLAAAGLLIGVMGAAPAIAAGKKSAKPKDPTLIELIDGDLKAIDKAIFGTPKKK